MRRNILPRARLTTLRAGEPVFDNVAGRVTTLAREIIKVRGLPDGACPFLESGSICLIHQDRPLECRLLFCEAPEAIAAAYDKNRLTRRDCVNPDGALFELIRHHEERCPAGKAAVLARLEAHGDANAGRELADLIRFDAAFREILLERAGIDPQELPFYLGRPLPEVLRPIRRRAARDPEPRP